jgi:hemolysin activation/secretion protein
MTFFSIFITTPQENSPFLRNGLAPLAFNIFAICTDVLPAAYSSNQRFNDRLSLHLELLGQFSSRNLDSSEKLYISGPLGVRAYGQGELGGDQGILSRNELRYLLNKPQSPTKVYLGGFYDFGAVKYNHDNPYGTNNSDTAKGAGIGLLITHNDNLSLRLDYAWKIGGPNTEDGSNGRFWAQMIYSY